jgi:hypothetical protein
MQTPTTTPRFDFKFTAETRPFHVFQAFAQFRKAKFRHWNLNRWSDEIGMDCKTTLMNIMQGKALPETDLAEKMMSSMQIDENMKSALKDLIEVYRLKKAKKAS